MSNKLSRWFYPKINKSVIKDIKKIIDSSYVNEGPFARKLEDKLAKICQRKFCSLTSSGSTALVTALLAAGVKKNDTVFVPGFSFIATANAIKIIGAKPKWVDIDTNTMCLSHEDLIKKIVSFKNKKKIPKFLVTVEVNGYSPNYAKIIKICKKNNIKLITDSAESLGSKYRNKNLGGFGLISTLSFSPNKIMTTGQGGAVLTNDKKMYNKMLAIKYQGNHIRGDGGADTYYLNGLNFKLSDLNAVIGLSQIRLINKRLNNTEKNFKQFKKILSNNNIIFPEIQKGGKRIWIDCIVLKNRNKFIKFLKKKKIAFREFWLPMNKQKSMMSSQNLKNVNFMSERGLWLTSNFDLTKKDIDETFN